jgi:3-dehydroquinate synthase
MKKIRVRAANGSYEIVCGRGVLGQAAKPVMRRNRADSVLLVSSPRVWRHWGSRIEGVFKGVSRAPILFDDRERAKNLSTAEQVCRRLARAGASRRATLVAVGGGVVGDVAGFVAASYARGVALVHVPTTLVAQVDSAIGGKTGVNLPEGKNLIGAFYPPKLVISDSDLLRTLPPREFRSGLYEVIKYGVIGDPGLFRYLAPGMDKILRREAAALDFIIER